MKTLDGRAPLVAATLVAALALTARPADAQCGTSCGATPTYHRAAPTYYGAARTPAGIGSGLMNFGRSLGTAVGMRPSTAYSYPAPSYGPAPAMAPPSRSSYSVMRPNFGTQRYATPPNGAMYGGGYGAPNTYGVPNTYGAPNRYGPPTMKQAPFGPGMPGALNRLNMVPPIIGG